MTCSICLENFGSEETNTHYAYNVPHRFHKKCIQPLLLTNPNCPFRCGYRYTNKDATYLLDRISNASYAGLSIALDDIVPLIVSLSICKLVASTCALITFNGMKLEGNSGSYSNGLNSGFLYLGSIMCVIKLSEPTRLQAMVNNLQSVALANRAGITVLEVASSLVIGTVSSFAVGGALSATNLGFIPTIAISAAIGSVFTGISAAWKRFNK